MSDKNSNKTKDSDNTIIEGQEITEPAKIEEEVSEFDKIKIENEKLRNEFLYLRAEFDNFRKNSIKERSDLIKYGPERMATALLNVVDIFDKALSEDIDQDNITSFVDGMKMTSVEFKNTLKNFGVNPIESKGQPFDPNYHEALGSEESTEVPEGHILQVFKKPYTFHDKVMRHGQVVIAKAVTPDDNSDSDEIIGFE